MIIQVFDFIMEKKIIRLTRRIFFLILMPLVFFPGFGQKYYFDNYSAEQGLHSRVYYILQDSQDFIWLGTGGGLAFFDGSTFENFSVEDNLASGGVNCLFEDAARNLWIGHLDGGISFFDGTKFTEIVVDTLDINGDITTIQGFDDHTLFVSTFGSGLLKFTYDPTTGDILKAQQYLGKQGLSDLIFYTFKTHDGTLYCLTDVGVYRYSADGDKFVVAIIPGLTSYWAKTTMFEDSKGNMWFGTYNGGLYKYDVQNDTMIIYDKRDGLAHNFVTYITEDSHSRIWVGTMDERGPGGGITVIQDDQLINYTEENGLPDNEIRFIMEDKEGNILIGSRNKGLSIFKGEQFKHIGEDEGMEDPNTYSIFQRSTDLFWFGTNNGIVEYYPNNPRGDRIRYLEQNTNIPQVIRFLKADNKGVIWIGSEGEGILEYRIADRRFIQDLALNSLLSSDKIIKALAIDIHNHIWIGTNDGLVYWEPETRYGKRFTQGDGIRGNYISTLFIDSKNQLWIGSEQRSVGVTKCNIESKEFSIIDLGIEASPTSIVESQDGLIWFGTESRGVFALHEDTTSVHLTIENGLLSNFISVVTVDEENHLYIGTNKGLNRYDQEEGKIYTFTRKNGYVGIETQDEAVFVDENGLFWFGTANGVTIMDPAKIRTESIDPLTHIRSISVNYELYSMEPDMKLGHKEKAIMIDYYSICLTNPEAVQYQVMLEGADADWRPVTQQTRAIYSALPPNKYTFNVKASNSYGEWNKEPVSYSFTIMPPFYLRWWFITGVVMILGALFYLYIIIRERALRRENAILEEKVALRTQQVVQKSKELEQKNKDITDSIRYAKRIQNAILPPEETFAQSFILFKPKDIVSGDFYWFYVSGSRQYIAAVDCTGHGVPGAFMSIIGHNSLNKIVKEYGFTEPATILDHLNDEVISTLKKQTEDDEVKDGMDLALVMYDMETGLLEYAGAHNPLYLVRSGELIETKADRFAIGRSSLETKRKFTNHEMEVKDGDVIYIFSDGYADQFGGPEGKKFKVRALKEVLLGIQNLTMAQQKEYLDKTIEEWKGQQSQIDDILIIGTRFSRS